MKIYVHTETCTQLIAVSFLIARSWKQPAQLGNEQTLQCYSIVKKNWVLIHATIWMNLWSSGVSKDTLSFNNSLEERTKLKRAILLTITVYSSKRTQIKISKGKISIKQDPGDTKLPAAFSQWSCADILNFYQEECVTTCMEYWQPGKLT